MFRAHQQRHRKEWTEVKEMYEITGGTVLDYEAKRIHDDGIKEGFMKGFAEGFAESFTEHYPKRLDVTVEVIVEHCIKEGLSEGDAVEKVENEMKVPSRMACILVRSTGRQTDAFRQDNC